MVHGEALLIRLLSYEDVEGSGEVVSVRESVSGILPSEAEERRCTGAKYILSALGRWRTVRHLLLACSFCGAGVGAPCCQCDGVGAEKSKTKGALCVLRRDLPIGLCSDEVK